jgi:hypothetical protein
MVLDSPVSKRNILNHVFHIIKNRLNHDKHNVIDDSANPTLDSGEF